MVASPPTVASAPEAIDTEIVRPDTDPDTDASGDPDPEGEVALPPPHPAALENGDPIAFASALAVLIGAGALAALWPAYLVLRRNPVDALRHS